ncbi:MAG: ABC transporter ATP-binding protein [Rhodospirillaceae bacterium]|nr:ABC transporter ATP-binding protein [Rhodospirillaceae bacterium]
MRVPGTEKNDSQPAIQLEGVHLTLASEAGRVNILQDIGLHIAAGETVSLVGPSGSGKTSLLLLIAGLEQATRGRIAIAGRDITRLPEDELALLRRDRVGIVFQNFHLIPTMTALENVAIPLELAGAADAFARAEAALQSVGLSHRLGHYPSQLSGGEQQRVALARALAPRPQVLLADEPTGNLDHETGARIIELLFAQAHAIDATLLLITHDPALAARCRRQLHMADGRLVSDSAGVAG